VTTSCSHNVLVGKDLNFADLEGTSNDRDSTTNGYLRLNQTDIVDGGSSSGNYSGNIDGGGYAFKNIDLVAAANTNYVGAVIGTAVNCKVHDIGVLSSKITGYLYLGGVVGRA